MKEFHSDKIQERYSRFNSMQKSVEAMAGNDETLLNQKRNLQNLNKRN